MSYIKINGFTIYFFIYISYIKLYNIFMRKEIIRKINYIIFILFIMFSLYLININIFNSQENNEEVTLENTNNKRLTIDFLNDGVISENNFKKQNTEQNYSKTYKLNEQDYGQILNFVFEGDENKVVQLQIPNRPNFDKEQKDNLGFVIYKEDEVLDLQQIQDRIKNSTSTLAVFAFNKATSSSFRSEAVQLLITIDYISHRQLKPVISGSQKLDRQTFELTLRFQDQNNQLINFQSTVLPFVSSKDQNPFSKTNTLAYIGYQSFLKEINVENIKEGIKIPTALELRKIVNENFKKQYNAKSGREKFTFTPNFEIRTSKYNILFRDAMTSDNYTLTLRNNTDYVWEDGTIKEKQIRQEYERDSIDNYENFGIDFEKESIGYKVFNERNIKFTVPARYYLSSRNFKFYDENIYDSHLNIKFENNKYIVVHIPAIKNFDPTDSENIFFTTYNSKDLFKSNRDSSNFYDEDFSYIKQNFVSYAENKTPIYAYNKATNSSFISKFQIYIVQTEIIEKKYTDFIISDNLEKENIDKSKIYIKNKYFISLYPNDVLKQIYTNFNIISLVKQDDNNYIINIEDNSGVIGNEQIIVRRRNSITLPSKNIALDKYSDFLDNPSSLKYRFTIENLGNIITLNIILNDKENDVFNDNNSLSIDDVTYVYHLNDYAKVNYTNNTITSNYKFYILYGNEQNESYNILAEDTNNFNFENQYGKKLFIQINAFSSRVFFYINLNGNYNPNYKTIYVFKDKEYEDITDELYEKLKNSFLNRENKKIKRYNPLTSSNPESNQKEDNILFNVRIEVKENIKIYSYDNLDNKVIVYFDFILDKNTKKTNVLENNYYSLNNGLVKTSEGKIKVTINQLNTTFSFDFEILKKQIPILNNQNLNEFQNYFNIEKNDNGYIVNLKDEFKENIEIDFDQKLSNQVVNKLTKYGYSLNLLGNKSVEETPNTNNKNKEKNTSKKNNSVIIVSVLVPLILISLIGSGVFIYIKKFKK